MVRGSAVPLYPLNCRKRCCANDRNFPMSNWEGNSAYNRPPQAWSNHNAGGSQLNNSQGWAPNYAPPGQPNTSNANYNNKRRWEDQGPRGHDNSNPGKRWRDFTHDEIPDQSGGGKRRRFNETGDFNRGGGDYRRPVVADPQDPKKLSFRDFLMTQPASIPPAQAQRKYRQYENEYRKCQSKRNAEDWISSRANDDVMRENYLPAVKEQRQAELRQASADASKLIQRLAQTDDFQHISFCKDTGNESIDSLDERVPFVENKTMLFIPIVPVFITRRELEKCVQGAEKEALATSFNSDGKDTIDLYKRVMESRTLYESDPKRRPGKRFERSVSIWYHPLLVDGMTQEDRQSVSMDDVLKICEAVMSKLSRRRVVEDHDFTLQAKYGRIYAPLPLPLGSLGTKMIEVSVDAMIKMSDAFAARRSMSGDTSLPYIPLKQIVDSIVELETLDAGEANPEETKSSTGEEGELKATVSPKRKMLVDRLEVCLTYLLLVHHIDFFDCDTQYQDSDDRFHCIGNRLYRLNKRLAYSPDSDDVEADLTTEQKDFLAHVERKITEISNTEAIEKEIAEREQEAKDFDAFNEELKEKFVSMNTVEEAPNRYRCPLSGKLFRGPEFIKKHILSKHEAAMTAFVKDNVDIEWIIKKHAEDPHRGDFLESKTAKAIGLRSRYTRKKGGKQNQRDEQGFRQYDATGGNNNSRKRSSSNARGGRQLDPRARNVQSYADVDAFEDDNLVYTR